MSDLKSVARVVGGDRRRAIPQLGLAGSAARFYTYHV
jgi:hypothetical protein